MPLVAKPPIPVPHVRGDTAAEREAQADRVIRREKRKTPRVERRTIIRANSYRRRKGDR